MLSAQNKGTEMEWYLCYGPFQLHAPFRPGAFNMCTVSTPFLGENGSNYNIHGSFEDKWHITKGFIYTFMFFMPGRFISQKKISQYNIQTQRLHSEVSPACHIYLPYVYVFTKS